MLCGKIDNLFLILSILFELAKNNKLINKYFN